MPVEIKELVIRAIVDRQAEPSVDWDYPSSRTLSNDSAADSSEIVQECVRQVLRILEQKKER